MDYRTLDLTIISAKGLNKVNLIGKMDVFAVVSINGTDQKQKTPVAKDADANPVWNFPMKFTVDESAALGNRLTLVVKIKTEGMFGGKDLGEVHVPVKELLDAGSDAAKPLQFVSYQVRRPSGKPKGELSFSYKFGERVARKAVAGKADEPVTAYPAAGGSSAYPPPYAASAAGGASRPYPPAGGAGYYPPPGGYPPAAYAYQQQPQQPGYGGYPPPPPPGYGGYPPQAGYGGYPPVQQPPKKNRMGMGLGAGLLGGALGGLLIGDMISDAGDGGGCGGGCGGGGCGGG